MVGVVVGPIGNLLLLLSYICDVVLDCPPDSYVYTQRQRPLSILRETSL